MEHVSPYTRWIVLYMGATYVVVYNGFSSWASGES